MTWIKGYVIYGIDFKVIIPNLYWKRAWSVPPMSLFRYSDKNIYWVDHFSLSMYGKCD